MKVGRNDRCPCGSGKKYKHCCLAMQEAPSPEELNWRRVRRATDDLLDEFVKELVRLYPTDTLDRAWDAFHPDGAAEPYRVGVPDDALFVSWFLFDCKEGAGSGELPPHARDVSVAQAYAARVGARLDPIARRYIDAACAVPFSFHEVIVRRPGWGFRVRDVMCGAEIDVIDRAASGSLQDGDIIFAKIVPIDGIALIEGIGATAIPPAEKPLLIELRSELGTRTDLFGAEVLRARAADLRGVYLGIAQRLRRRTLPEMRNTDGEPIAPHTLVYDIDAPQAAFEKLRDLAAGMTLEEIDAEVERDADSRFVRATLEWRRLGNTMHAHWDNTILGRILIDGRRLTAEVNSAQRAETLRVLIEARLGDGARARPTVIQSVESMLRQLPAPGTKRAAVRVHPDPAAQPEAQQALREFLREHYVAWVDQQLPALGNRTPREAVHDADGREAVEALIKQFERDGASAQPPLDPDILRELRTTLGLPAPS
jgi:hypothetical protein